MGPGFDFLNNINLILYLVLVTIPLLPLLGVWGRRRGGIAFAVFLPIMLITAHTVCTIEEKMFIEAHKESGSGPTPRCFDSSSWLAYDPSEGVLSGAD